MSTISDITIAKATLVADAKAIAGIYQDRQPTRINLLTHGAVEPSVFHAGLEKMFADSLQDPDEVLYAARDTDGKVVSYINLARKSAVVPMTEEVSTLYPPFPSILIKIVFCPGLVLTPPVTEEEEGSRKLRSGGDAWDERAVAHRDVGAARPNG